MFKFNAVLDIIDGNPFVFVPLEILDEVFQQAGKNKGGIPVRGSINGKPFQQTLLRYRGDWRLYINMKMLKHSPKRIGETIIVDIAYEPSDRSIPAHPKLVQALEDNQAVKNIFDSLSPSKQ